MDELREHVKGYIQIVEMLKLKNEIRQASLNWEKGGSGSNVNPYKLDKRHKRQPLQKGPRYEM